MKRQCTAHLSDGSGRRCKLSPVRGSTVCHKHGGSAPQVRKSARDRLLEAADPAVALLLRTIEEADQRKIFFHPSVLRAIQLVLDRAGLGPVSRVELEQIEQAAKGLSEAQGRQVGEVIAAILRDLTVRGLLQQGPEVVEVVRQHLLAMADGSPPPAPPAQVPPVPNADEPEEILL